jgi:8-hydroxy-5-deazaflavin:NADPH oxidoreductase
MRRRDPGIIPTRSEAMTRRREFLVATAAIAVVLPAAAARAAQAAKRMRIGVIGSGRIGGTLGGLWAKAGHEVIFSDRDPEQTKRAAREAGPNARIGNTNEEAALGDAVLIAVPYSALPAIAKEVGSELKGKVMIDPNNPIPRRDGDMAIEPREKGAALATAAMFPGVRTFRAFNAIGYATFQKEAHRTPPRLAVPVAADDRAALELGMQLVEDAGFEPVAVGTLAQSRIFDLGAPAGGARTAAELRKILNP